jgi:Fur family ferric uptake transcriptional regulator
MSHCHTVIGALRDRGHRITPQREIIIEAISHSVRHMTAEEIFGEVQKRTNSVNIATVYRTLEFLVEEGLASRTDLGGGREIYCGKQHGPHIHLVCSLCGAVTEADGRVIDSLQQQLYDRYGFTADLHHASIFGLCDICQAKAETEKRALQGE